MLLNQGIRTKLLAVLSLPIAALVIVASLVSWQAFAQARTANQVKELAIGAAAFGDVISSLQDERTVSLAHLDKRAAPGELKPARDATDQAMQRMAALTAAVDLSTLSPQASAAMGASMQGHGQLPALRAAVNKRAIRAAQVAEQYTGIIAADVALPQRIGDGLTDRAIGAQATAYSAIERLVEAAILEREAGLDMIAAGASGAASSKDVVKQAALQEQALRDFRLNATPSQIEALDAALTQPAKRRAAYNQMKRAMLTLPDGGRIDLDPSDWRIAASARASVLSDLRAPVAASASELAAQVAADANTRAYLVLGGGLSIVALFVLLGLVFARAITRPLRTLTEMAGHIRDELPTMVERMAKPGEGPGLTLPDIDITSNDEVGQLASAFRDVNATTIRVAQEQAALRASIAEMFVNVARRNHVLLSRQLSFIDQLERTEENPDTLENLFRLDHLATRMRRNAESLIVLAGIDAGRRLRRPMPLSDVIRTSVSEIERYDRVDLAVQADPPMLGHVALTSAHMVAELLENATQFSNPDTRVIVSTAFSSHGVRVTITDLGLGMTWDEISDANERIANPPMSEVVGSQRLGFYVVGRLARRLDATVELKPGRSQGTVVTIDLPPALFVAGAVTEAPGEPKPAALQSRPAVDDVVDLTAQAPAVTPAAPARLSPPAEPTARVEPRGPALPAPFPDHLRGSAEPVAPLLPRRDARDRVPPAVPAAAAARPEPAAEGSEPPRTGIFGGFRSRRSATPPPAVPEAAPVDGSPVVGDPAATFVPRLVPAGPASASGLPQRDQAEHDLPRDDDAAPGPLDEGWVAAEPVELHIVQQAEPEVAPDGASKTAAPSPAVPTRAIPELAPDAEPTPARPIRAPGVASMDILPSRGASRGLRRRRPSRPAPVLAPVGGPSGAHLPTPPAPPASTPASTSPLASPGATEPAASAGRPTPSEPIAAPPSLFAPAAPAAAALPPRAPAVPMPAEPVAVVPAVPAFAAAQSLRERSAMASEALSELSALSTYRPEALQTAPASLVRRTPQATPAGQLPPPAPDPAGTRRQSRNAADVRSMLSGFQAGVQRGRTSPGARGNHGEDA